MILFFCISFLKKLSFVITHVFYTFICCKQTLAPIYEKLGTVFAGDKEVLIAKVDATQEDDLAKKYEVSGFPTLLWFPPGKY